MAEKKNEVESLNPEAVDIDALDLEDLEAVSGGDCTDFVGSCTGFNGNCERFGPREESDL